MKNKTFPSKIRMFFAAFVALPFLMQPLAAGDWPHWLGPNGDNVVAADENFDPNLNNWEIAWQKEVGLGYSSITTANGKAYTMGHDGSSIETIVCFDAATGEKIWDYAYKGELLPRMHVGGPNASVTISGGKAYAISKDGQVFCLDADEGTKVWSIKLTHLLKMEVPQWGFGSSPVEYEGDILINAGKTVALDKGTGKPSWISKKDRRAGYGSPAVFSKNGKDYIATMDADGLSILDASNGAEIARFGQKVKYDMNATTPAVFEKGEQIFFYTNSNSAMLAFDGKKLTAEWGDRKLQNALSGSVLIGNALYGLNGSYKNEKTSLYSRNIRDGKANWVVPRYGYASLIAVGDTLVILTENGDLVTAPAKAKEYKEISRKKLLEAICWTNPTYGDGKIFVRNEHGVLICLTPV